MSATFGGAAAPPREPFGRDPALLERFSDRARALFYARLAFLALGLTILAVPPWSALLGATSSTAFIFYFVVIGYSVLNYLLVDHPKLGRGLTYGTLCLDIAALTMMARLSGGLRSPVMAAHIIFVIFLLLLFSSKRAATPAFLALPIAGALHHAFDASASTSETTFLVAWYATLSGIVVYVLLFLHRRDERRRFQLGELSKAQETAIVTQERLRLAREIHDGLGGSLSSLIIQAEFIQRTAQDENLRSEITELKTQAEEAIEELRRSLTMMRRDFDLHKALEDYCMRFQERARVWCSLKVRGRTQRIPSEMQLAIFRLLQECLTNVQKHGRAKNVDVRLKYDGDIVSLNVSDDGVGFDPRVQKPGHYGLSNLKARATKFRGTVDVQSTLGAGATVHVALVIPKEGSHVALLPGP